MHVDLPQIHAKEKFYILQLCIEGAGLVKRSTEKPGVRLKSQASDWKARRNIDTVRVPGAARNFSPRVNFQSSHA